MFSGISRGTGVIRFLKNFFSLLFCVAFEEEAVCIGTIWLSFSKGSNLISTSDDFAWLDRSSIGIELSKFISYELSTSIENSSLLLAVSFFLGDVTCVCGRSDSDTLLVHNGIGKSSEICLFGRNGLGCCGRAADVKFTKRSCFAILSASSITFCNSSSVQE